MKKLLITTALVLSTILLHGQDKPKPKYRVNMGGIVGAPYQSNIGGWFSIGDVGIEYAQGTVNDTKLFPTETKFTSIGINLFYLKKLFVGGGLQTLTSINDNSTLPYVNLGTSCYFGKNDIFVLRGEIMSGAKGITTLNIGIGLNL